MAGVKFGNLHLQASGKEAPVVVMVASIGLIFLLRGVDFNLGRFEGLKFLVPLMTMLGAAVVMLYSYLQSQGLSLKSEKIRDRVRRGGEPESVDAARQGPPVQVLTDPLKQFHIGYIRAIHRRDP